MQAGFIGGIGRTLRNCLGDIQMSTVNFESPSVQTYVGILQSVINRMASNSAGCKTWCITLVSATIVIIAGKGKPDYVWIALVPIALFFFLDSYYLGLEKGFRTFYDTFIQKLHSSTATIEDVYVVTSDAGLCATISATAKACVSVSIWPFYTLLGVMLIIVKIWII